MKKRILLIEPPYYRLFKDTYSLVRYPLSLGYLAAEISKKTDWNVRVYNADFNPESEEIKVGFLAGEGFNNYLTNLNNLSQPIWKKVVKTIKKYKPDVIGISVKSPNFVSACRIAELAKKINKNIIIIMGGPHVSMSGKDIFKCVFIDVGVKGEGENTIIDLLDAIDKNTDYKKIKGIIYRENLKVIENPPREFIKDLDLLSFPHKKTTSVLINYKSYPLTAFQYIFTIRGCPYCCFFCGSRKIWSRNVRFRSITNIISEMKDLQKKGIKSIHFDDDTFGVSKNRIKSLCEAIINYLPEIKWSCELHVRLVDDDTIKLMKKAGCYLIQIGVESGNNKILREMRKNITIEEAFNAAKIIKKYGIILQTFFMVGFPQETEETLSDTLRAIKKIKSDYIAYSIFTPYPGTEAFDFCRGQKLVDKNFDVSLYNHQSPKNCFCINLNREEFRYMVSKIEKIVDRKNSVNSLRRKIINKTTEIIKNFLYQLRSI